MTDGKSHIGTAILWLMIGFILGMAIFFILNNFSTQKVYDVASCTVNQYDCACPAWDGECTAEISDECCEDTVEVRWCEGTVDSYYECYDKYCIAEGKKCEGMQTIDGKYECGCAVII